MTNNLLETMSNEIIAKRINELSKKRFNPLLNGNIKVGNMYTFNTIAGSENYTVDGIPVDGTCSGLCAGCERECYAKRAYSYYPSTITGHGRRTILLKYNLPEVEKRIVNQLTRAKKFRKYVRIHASGEFFNIEEVLMWKRIALQFPQHVFYTYTKAFDLWENEIDSLSDNFIVNVSIWHEVGIDFYNEHKDSKNVRAFVYCDGYDYTKHGLRISAMCPAYNERGKMNHEKTCDKCGLCNDTKCKSLVNGCFDH